ncbi:eukaryotic translation initiation factor eIF2A family [Micractinium conductrix]|uniref:Eukaryotic translation initiation factor 2A n=1 Tax=Micractinium conductrix TaxID=554055 RepID=A0A2P6VA44_9CHLO|nr:eukaryotic translation initiation factor eIF2A family [Micractinium conductrix]|eukprot:PSC70931.1 eukaryotic translation initiation factor eIF2A family [Micractinium conductrix]
MASLQAVCRTPEELQFLSGPPQVASHGTVSGAASSLVFTPDATRLLVVGGDVVAVLDAASRAEQQRLSIPAVMAAALSPQGTYMVTFQRPTKNDSGAADKNLKVWRLADGECVLSLYQKMFSKDSWPSVQFTADESLAFQQVTNAVNIYSAADFGAGVSKRMPLKGVAGVAVCPAAGTPLVAAYVPESKGSPGFIALYDYSAISTSGDAPAPLCRKSFYRANAAQLMWNSTGTALLAMTAADVDATNQSYYGEQKLYFLAAAGSNECAVPLAKEGPIHDVQWSPKGDHFVVVAGFMPAKSTLFTDKCVAKFDLGSGPYSTARWNPFGRFFVLAGIGNLPGDLAFYDKKADGKCRSMGNTRAENAVTAEWSPCGRYLLTATVAPRMRVDNGFQIFKYDGTLLAREKRNVLLEASWVPAAEGTFEDRPQSPRGAAGGDGAAAALPAQPVRAAGYIPPHQRGKGAAAVAAVVSNFSLARDAADKGGKIPTGAVAARAAPASNLPPGAAPPPSKSASKNAKRRVAAKKKEGSVDGAAAGVAGMTLPPLK